jgi:hypothetical protein
MHQVLSAHPHAYKASHENHKRKKKQGKQMFRPWKFQRLRPLKRDSRSRKVYIGLIHSRVVPPPAIKYSSFSSEQRELSNRL